MFTKNGVILGLPLIFKYFTNYWATSRNEPDPSEEKHGYCPRGLSIIPDQILKSIHELPEGQYHKQKHVVKIIYLYFGKLAQVIIEHIV